MYVVAPGTAAIEYGLLFEGTHAEVLPVIAPGVGIAGRTVMAKLPAGLVPQVLVAVTESVPPVAPAPKAIVGLAVVPLVIVAPVPL